MSSNPILEIVNKTQQRVFKYIHNNNLIYNTSWEDPRIDRNLMKLDSESSVVMITSAGCNALDYLLDDPAIIHSIDVNPRQNALLELKLESIRQLEFDTYFELFGQGTHKFAREIYFDLLRTGLSEETRNFWDEKYFYFLPHREGRTFYYRGTSGNMAWLVHKYLMRKKQLWENVQLLLEAGSLSEQKEIYDKIEPDLWNSLSRFLVQQPFTMSFLGVPKAQMNLIERQYPDGLYGFIRSSLRHVFTEVPVSDNYFWRVYLTGEYSEDCCPGYLKRGNFSFLKERHDKIDIHNDTFLSFLKKNPGAYSHYVLLDHQDWLAWHKPEVLSKEWKLILKNSRMGTRVLMRSASNQLDFVPENIRNDLHFYEDLTKKLHEQDRVGTYASLHFGEVQ